MARLILKNGPTVLGNAKYVNNWQKNNPDKCAASQIRYRKLSPIKYLVSVARRRAKKRDIPFNLTHKDIEWRGICPLLEIKIDPLSDNQEHHPSLDRIDNSKGYIRGNVWIISHRANRLKNDSTSTELFRLATNLRKKEIGDI